MNDFATSTPLPSVSDLRRPIREHHISVWGPPQYTNWVDESLSWKQGAYIGDWSFLPSMIYTGPDALRLFSDVSVNSMGKFAIGQSKHIIQCNEDGKIIDDAILSRTAEDQVISFSTFWADYIRRQGNYDVEAQYVDLAKLHLQGPTSLAVLEAASGQSIRDLAFMRSTSATIAGHEINVLRQGMSGELGFELQFPAEHAGDVRAALLAAGKDLGIREMGGRVAMLNHLEAYYPTQGLDYLPAIFDERGAGFLAELAEQGGGWLDMYYRIAGSYESDNVADWYRSPVEFGWGNRIAFDHDFIGADALREEVANPRRVGATLVWNSADVVEVYASFFRKGAPLPDFMEMPQDPRGYFYTDKVLDASGSPIGVTSSRGYSAYFREMISLAVVDVEAHEIGREVVVVWGNPGTPQREIRATIAPAPYKENRARVDLTTL